jgi:hypothetical protein
LSAVKNRRRIGIKPFPFPFPAGMRLRRAGRRRAFPRQIELSISQASYFGSKAINLSLNGGLQEIR